MSSLREKSLKGLFWDFSGRIGLQGVGFVVSIVLARLLAPEEFGLLAIINVFINLASVFLDFGFSTALIQKHDVREDHYSAVFYMNVTMGFLLAAIVFLLAPLVGRFYDKEILVNVTRLMSLGIFISSFGQVMRARLRREMNFRPISLASIYAAIISGIIAMTMAWRGFGVWSLAVQSVVLQLLTVIFLYFFCKLKIKLKFSQPALSELWPFSSKLFFSGLLDTIFLNFDALIIGKLLSPATLGYYHRAKSLENFGFRYTASTLASVLLPGLSSLQNDPDKIREAVMKVFHILSFVSFLLAGVFFVSAREIIIFLFTDKWEYSIWIFQILILFSFTGQIQTINNNVLLSIGRASVFLNINVMQKILLLINFSTLFIWDLKIYLFGYSVIRLLTLAIGLHYSSVLLTLKKLLYLETLKYILVYGASLILCLLVKHILPISNNLAVIIFITIVYTTIYIIISGIFKSVGRHYFHLELINLWNSIIKNRGK